MIYCTPATSSAKQPHLKTSSACSCGLHGIIEAASVFVCIRHPTKLPAKCHPTRTRRLMESTPWSPAAPVEACSRSAGWCRNALTSCTEEAAPSDSCRQSIFRKPRKSTAKEPSEKQRNYFRVNSPEVRGDWFASGKRRIQSTYVGKMLTLTSSFMKGSSLWLPSVWTITLKCIILICNTLCRCQYIPSLTACSTWGSQMKMSLGLMTCNHLGWIMYTWSILNTQETISPTLMFEISNYMF